MWWWPLTIFILVPFSLAVYRITLELPTLTVMTRLQSLSPGQHLLQELERWNFDFLLSWYNRLTGLTNLQCRVSVYAVLDTCWTPTLHIHPHWHNYITTSFVHVKVCMCLRFTYASTNRGAFWWISCLHQPRWGARSPQTLLCLAVINRLHIYVAVKNALCVFLAVLGAHFVPIIWLHVQQVYNYICCMMKPYIKASNHG